MVEINSECEVKNGQTCQILKSYLTKRKPSKTSGHLHPTPPRPKLLAAARLLQAWSEPTPENCLPLCRTLHLARKLKFEILKLLVHSNDDVVDDSSTEAGNKVVLLLEVGERATLL